MSVSSSTCAVLKNPTVHTSILALLERSKCLYESGSSIDALPEASASVREAAERVLGFSKAQGSTMSLAA